MFEHILAPRRTSRRRRLAATLISTSQCGVLGSAMVMMEPAMPEPLDEVEPAVLVEWISQAASGGGGGAASAPPMKPPPTKPPPTKPPPSVVVPVETVPSVVPQEVQVAVEAAMATVSPPVELDLGGGARLGLGGPGAPGPGIGPGTGPGECPPGEDCSGATACPPGEVCDGDAPVAVQGLRVRRRSQPRFPPAARQLGLDEARCVLDLTVDTRGHVADVEISGCSTVFHESAERAAWAWRFVPHKVGGEARMATFRLVINYRLD